MRTTAPRAAVLGAALLASVPSIVLAGVIGRSCEASLSAFGGGAGPSTTANTASCSGSIYDASTIGPVGSGGTSIAGGGASAWYDSRIEDGGDGFVLQVRSGGSGSIDLRSDAVRGAGSSVSYGGWVSSFDSFAVDRPYTFELEYEVGSFSSLGLSGNLLHGSGGSQGYFGNGSRGVLTGLLEPGQVYSLSAYSTATLFGSASQGLARGFNGSWSGPMVSLRANAVPTAVPTPGAGVLVLAGVALMGAWRRRSGR